jgi:hypothetical protein
MMQHHQNAWKLLLDTFDSAKADRLIESFRAGGVWQTPTLLDLSNCHPGGGSSVARRCCHRVCGAGLFEGVASRGVRILAGTDTPYPYCVPGFALHQELALLVEAGLSPAEALRTATWNPAEFLHVSRDYGSLEAGGRWPTSWCWTGTR